MDFAKTTDTITFNENQLLVWANVSEGGTPAKLYVENAPVPFWSVDQKNLTEVQKDSKYIFYRLTMDRKVRDKLLTLNKCDVIAWTTVGKKAPRKLYLQDKTIDIAKVDSKALTVINEDSKETYYRLTLTESGNIPQIPHLTESGVIPQAPHFWIGQFIDTSPTAFLNFWAPQYTSALEHLYEENISVKPFTDEAIMKLFEWKNGSKLAEKKRKSVVQNYVSRKHSEWVGQAIRSRRGASLQELTEFAREFLKTAFPEGGPIWRIFWLHCCNQAFPIYDQNVHRAMIFMEEGRIEELNRFTAQKKIELYLTRYLPFHRHFSEDQRNIDRALFMFGDFVRNWPGFCSKAGSMSTGLLLNRTADLK